MIDVSDWSDERLEAELVRPTADHDERGAAKAELTKRQRKHELDRDEARARHENAIFDAENRNQLHRKNFDQRLAEENRAHAEKIAKEQMKPAENSARATRLAAWAAALSAVGGIAAAIVSGMTYIDQQRLERISAHPLFNFYTEDSPDATKIGIEIENDGSSPQLVSKIEYFVDGHSFRDHDEAIAQSKVNPSRVDYIDFDPGDKMAGGEKDWLFYWTSRICRNS